MKRTLMIILSVVCIFSLAACGLFSSESASTSAGDIQLTDSYTYKDPADLKFTTRYAFTSGESQDVAESYKMNYNVDCVAEYMFIYADKDDKAVAEYDYFVFKTEEDADSFVKQISEFGFGTTLEQDGAVVWQAYDASGMEDLILMQQQYSGLSGSTCSVYAQFTKESYGYMDVQ